MKREAHQGKAGP